MLTTRHRVEAETSVAKTYSKRLRRYLISRSEQKDEDNFLHFQLARQTYGMYDFVLSAEHCQTWATSRSSMLLGIVGGPGSGKPIISAAMYSKAMTMASGNSPVIWLHCCPTRSSPVRLLRALIWKTIEQRPDILLKHLHR